METWRPHHNPETNPRTPARWRVQFCLPPSHPSANRSLPGSLLAERPSPVCRQFSLRQSWPDTSSGYWQRQRSLGPCKQGNDQLKHILSRDCQEILLIFLMAEQSSLKKCRFFRLPQSSAASSQFICLTISSISSRVKAREVEVVRNPRDPACNRRAVTV